MAVDFERDVLTPGRRAALVLSIKDIVRRGMESGLVPKAAGYVIEMTCENFDQVWLRVVLTDSKRQPVAGPFSFGSVRLVPLDGFQCDEVSEIAFRSSVGLARDIALLKGDKSRCCEAPLTDGAGRFQKLGPRYCSQCGQYCHNQHRK